MKRRQLSGDPELFTTYCAMAAEARDFVGEHVDHLTAMVARLVREGTARGEFAPGDPAAMGRAVLSATARFHHPAHASEWSHPDLDRDFEEVWALILSGLKARD